MMETNRWIKATGCEAGSCIEVMAHEHTIECDSGNCVEVMASGEVGMVYVRKNSFTYDEWRVFIDGAKAGEFDV